MSLVAKDDIFEKGFSIRALILKIKYYGLVKLFNTITSHGDLSHTTQQFPTLLTDKALS